MIKFRKKLFSFYSSKKTNLTDAQILKTLDVFLMCATFEGNKMLNRKL